MPCRVQDHFRCSECSAALPAQGVLSHQIRLREAGVRRPAGATAKAVRKIRQHGDDGVETGGLPSFNSGLQLFALSLDARQTRARALRQTAHHGSGRILRPCLGAHLLRRVSELSVVGHALYTVRRPPTAEPAGDRSVDGADDDVQSLARRKQFDLPVRVDAKAGGLVTLLFRHLHLLHGAVHFSQPRDPPQRRAWRTRGMRFLRALRGLRRRGC